MLDDLRLSRHARAQLAAAYLVTLSRVRCTHDYPPGAGVLGEKTTTCTTACEDHQSTNRSRVTRYAQCSFDATHANCQQLYRYSRGCRRLAAAGSVEDDDLLASILAVDACSGIYVRPPLTSVPSTDVHCMRCPRDPGRESLEAPQLLGQRRTTQPKRDPSASTLLNARYSLLTLDQGRLTEVDN